MEQAKVKELMVPLAEYATVSEDATLFEAVLALEEAQRRFDQRKDRHRAQTKAPRRSPQAATSGQVQATWGSDTPGVATVDSNGRATAVTSGITTLFADYQGLRATRRLRVLPDYHGRWQGD